MTDSARTSVRDEKKRATAVVWQRIEAYFDRALELHGDARETWLAELESHSPEVAREVRSSLEQLADLDRRQFLAADSLPCPEVVTLEGKQIGPYTLDRPVGHGGMGTVWLCHRSDGRYEGQVAIKLLNTALVGQPA